MSDESMYETVKYYTRARKFPQLLGRFPDGTKIPGGPYTIHQLMAGIGVLAIGGVTMRFWGVFGGLVNIVVLLGLTFATVFVIGRLPLNGRNPFLSVLGFYKVTSSPRGGRYQGRPIRIRRPRRVTHKTNVWSGPLPDTGPQPIASSVTLEQLHQEPATKGRPRTIATTPGQRALPPAGVSTDMPLTGVQALLARAGSDSRDKAVR